MDKALQREQIRKRVERYREKHSVTKGEGEALHPIMYALLDPEKREKLQRICDSLRRRGLLSKVYYGMRSPLDFGTIGDLLEATDA